jgi:mRNA-degrading endonuclease RelE of RelBE toxin-antitoxin system
MNLEVVWGDSAIRALLSMPWRDAERIDAAVMRFAETGSGDVRSLPEDNPITRRLHVGSYRVRLAIDPRAAQLWVVMIYRSDRYR